MNDHTDKNLDQHSDRLLHALDDMKRSEVEKRHEERSTDRFHELAAEVEEKSRVVWSEATKEREIGSVESPLPQERDNRSPGDWTQHDDR